MKRRMAAILVADVVGYSSLMEADEDGTPRRLAACGNLIDAGITKCDGRLFKAMGDAVLRLTFQTRRSRLYSAAAHAALGEVDRARHIVAEAIASASDLTADYVENREFYRDSAIKRTLIEFLVGAGLPRSLQV